MLRPEDIEAARAIGRAVRLSPAQKDRLREIFRPSLTKLNTP
ncbi:hypothetical protein [Alloactinosynnema sp. L-07]|nr:hypothetical protein [Alloactinosynnema sp. L-07]